MIDTGSWSLKSTVVTDVFALSFRATEVSLVSVVLLALVAQLEPVVLLDLPVTTEPR